MTGNDQVSDSMPTQASPTPHNGNIVSTPATAPQQECHSVSDRSSGSLPTSEPYRPLRRPPRKRGPDRGLPPLADRLKLAKTYLDLQGQHWPELVKRGVLPDATDDVLAAMAGDLEWRHVNRDLGETGQAMLLRVTGAHGIAELYAAYIRYSCDNSNPRSLDDQLCQILRRARDLKVFVPWCLVFADASLSGADASREGYNALKQVLNGTPTVGGVMIDDFSRAGRDTLEWFRLAAWAKRHNKNVRGATDDFNLNTQAGQMMLHVYAMFSEFFLTQLREKVLRGMNGAADRRISTGRPGLGYGLVPKLDTIGRPVLGADGIPSREKRIHLPTMAHVEMARRMLLDDDASVGDVVRAFNRVKVDGSEGWTDCSLRRTLSNPIYFGFDVFNRTRNEWDPETCKRKTHINPRRLWKVQAVPHLRVWDRRTFLAILRKLRGRPGRRSRFAGKKKASRNERRPKRMLSGLMACQCGQELKEVRGGRNAAYGCYHGYFGTHGCTMDTAKAASIIEEALLDYVQEHFLTPKAIELLVERANARARREAARPPIDVAPLEAEIANLNKRRARLMEFVEGDTSPEMDPVRQKFLAIGMRIRSLSDELNQARAQAAGPLPTLTVEDVQRELADLRTLMAEDGRASAEVIRRIIGTIAVTHEKYGDQDRYGGSKGGRWSLTFTPRLAPALIGQLENSPHAADLRSKLGEAATAEAGHAQLVTLIVDRRKSLHERLAPRVKPYIGQVNPATGSPYTRVEVAAILGFSADVVYLAWRSAKSEPARKAPAA